MGLGALERIRLTLLNANYVMVLRCGQVVTRAGAVAVGPGGRGKGPLRIGPFG